MRLNRIIQKLLANNNFISLPGIGSFVQTLEPAKLSTDGVTFIPPKQTILFSTSRTFNDELIERYLQDTEGLTAIETRTRVQQYISRLKEELEKGTTITFENVGTLQKKGDGSLYFEPFAEKQRASSTFGLQPIKLDPKERVSHSPHKQSEPQIKKPVASSSNFTAVGLPIMLGVAAVVVLMLISSLLIFVPELRFWSHKSETTLDIIAVKSSNQPSTTRNLPLDSASQNITDTTSNKYEDNVEIITDKKQALFYQEPAKPDNKTYYLIAGSFEQIDNAQQLINSLTKLGHSPELLHSNGYYRVAISKFSDKNGALRELARLRSQKATKSVWVLGL